MKEINVPSSLRVPPHKHELYKTIYSKKVGDETWWSALERILKEKKVI